MPEDYITFINELIAYIKRVNKEKIEAEERKEIENEMPDNEAEKERDELDLTKFL